MKIILDTNMLMVPVQFKIDIFSRLHGDLYTLDLCIKELEKLAARKGKDNTAARVALDLVEKNGLETINVGKRELDETYEKLNSGKDPDVVILGCPHASLREISTLSGKLKDKHLKKPIWICTSRIMKEAADRMGFTEIIEKAGGYIVADTCMVVSPIEKMGYKTTGVNSGKAANYLPGFCKQEVVFENINKLIEAQL